MKKCLLFRYSSYIFSNYVTKLNVLICTLTTNCLQNLIPNGMFGVQFKQGI